jgi:dolichol-phosphate mannosyltransferase
LTDSVELTVVVPAFNEEDNIGPMYERLTAALDDRVASLEILYVDDGSRDGTWARIREVTERDPRARGLRFARNFGHQAALSAGVDAAHGTAVVIIDADLQDPPEVILDMISQWRDGFEVVFAQRTRRHGETWFKRMTAATFYRLLHGMTQVEIPVDTGDFRLMGPRAVAAFRALPERNRFIRGLVSWIGFPQTAVLYERQPRHAGDTKYPIRKMLRFALDGITSFSFVPLRLATWIGGLTAALAALGLAALLVTPVLGGPWLPLALLAAGLVLLGGVQLISVGLLGEYLARVFDEVKGRPLYLIGEDTAGAPAVTPPRR